MTRTDGGRLYPEACPICDGEVRRRLPPIPSFIHGSSCEIFECSACGLVTSWPVVIPDHLYEAIYRRAGELEGYSRYARYARNVARKIADKRDALAYLAGQEDVYWAVQKTLRRDPRSASWRIVDIGSGLGYVTAALRSAGYDCVGIDIAATAVTQAIANFGPSFEQQDLFTPPPEYIGSYDAALLLETIEHVANPVAYLAGVKRWLRPGGRIILTTPNRDIHPSKAHWRTDLPPVHMHWFTERAVDEMARSVGLTARHIDFTRFNRDHLQTIALGDMDQVQAPSLGRDLRPLRRLPMSTRVMERLRDFPKLAAAARAAYDHGRRNRMRLTSNRSLSLAAILEEPEDRLPPVR